jgi:hypothetical protein
MNGRRGVHDHVVDVYEDDDHLVEDVTRHLLAGLRNGERAVAVATAGHLDAFADGLRAGGVDPVAARDEGRYVALDAAETLGRCLRNGVPDADRFQAAITPAMAGDRVPSCPVRAYGEMVALLWADGYTAGALAIEAMWNELSTRLRFSLCCGYPLEALASADLDHVGHVCAQHSSIVPPRTYATPRTRARRRGDGWQRSQLFLPTASSVRPVRRFVADALDEWGHRALAEDAMLVASELATNAVMHVGGPFRVALDLGPAGFRISVEDTSRELPQRLAPPAATAGGRGMAVVDALSSAVGVEQQACGKVVWADLPTPPAVV